MTFLKKNIWTVLSLALVLTLSMFGDASAQQATIISTAQNKALNVFQAVKSIMFIVGGFGLVGLAWAAVFGKVHWKWFAALAFGLAVLAAAGAIIQYATGEGSSGYSGASAFGDTFSQSTN